MAAVPGTGVPTDGDLRTTTTRGVLEAACRDVGLVPSDAVLVRRGENAIFGLAIPSVVARVARHTDTPRKEVEVARWLAECELPAARLREDLAQLHVVGDKIVTWWELIEDEGPQPAFAELAGVLRRLHDLPTPTTFVLPPFTAMPRVLGRLDSAMGLVDEDDLDFLHEGYERLLKQVDRLKFELPPGPIHGDAHIGNLMRGRDGVVLLIDFEAFAWGPREWDVCILGAAYAAFGWMDRDEYERCVAAYGWDPLEWDGFPVFRAVRELNMTTWLMQRLGESPEIDEEVATRIADLRRGEGPRRWRQF